MGLKILFGEMRIKVSVSLGIAMYPSEGTTYNQLYQTADSRMYRNKREIKEAS